MKTWNCVDTKTIYEMIPDTVATDEYNSLVDQLLLEEKYTGKMGAAHTGQSSYWAVSILKLAKKHDDHTRQLDVVKKKIKEAQDARRAAEVDTLYLQRFDLETQVKKEKEAIDLATYLDAEIDAYTRALRVVIANYKDNRDKEYLRKGVYLMSKTSKERTKSQEEIVMRAILMDDIGTISEFYRLFDLATLPIEHLIHLHGLYTDSLKYKNTPRYLMDVCLHYSNQLTETGEYRSPTVSHEDGMPTRNGISWRSGDEEADVPETETKKNETRDVENEKKSEKEVNYYMDLSRKWI